MPSKSIALTELGLSALLEAGNIGAGNAMTALATMVHDRVEMSTPNGGFVSITQFAGIAARPDAPTVGVYLRVTGDAAGHALLLWPHGGAMLLCDRLLDRPAGETRDLDELECSALMELGNVLASTYVVAIGNMSGICMFTSPPAIAIDSAAAIVSAIGAEAMGCGDQSLVLVTQIGGMMNQVGGTFVFIPDPASLPLILRALQVEC